MTGLQLRGHALFLAALLFSSFAAAQDTTPTPTAQEPASADPNAPEKSAPADTETSEDAAAAKSAPSLETNVQQPTAPRDERRPVDREDDKDGFQFKIDPAILDFRITDVGDENSAKVEEYRDFYSGFGVPLLRVTAESSDFNRKLDARARNVARDDAEYGLYYNVAGRYSIIIEDNHIPHNFGNDGTLLHAFTAPGALEISDSAQGQLQGALEQQFAANPSGVTFNFLNGLITPYIDAATRTDFGLQRERGRVRADIAKMKTWNLSAEVFHESRDGTRPYGSSFGFNGITELPEPIDYDTVNVALAAEWNSKKAGARIGVRHSNFTNEVDSLIYDNPWRATDSTDASAYQSPSSSSINGSSRGQNALAPDNTANEFFASGQTRIGEKTWVSGSLGFIAMRQDDELLPYTVNTAINQSGGAPFDATDPANLPVSSADASVDVLNFAVAAGTRLLDALDVRAHLRSYDYNNNSERIALPGYARFDAVWEDIGRITVPFAYTRRSFGAEAAYRFGGKTRVVAGYTFESWDREFREVDSSDDGILHLGVTTRAIDKLWLRADYRHGDRSVDEYRVEAQEESFTDPEGVNNLPDLRKYDEAARVYDDLSIQASYAFSGKLTATAGFSTRNEEYQNEEGDPTEFGLQSSDLVRFNAEVSFSPTDRTSIYAFGDHADRDIFQRARQSGSTPSTRPIDDWQVAFDEINDTLGAGLNLSLSDRFTADVSAVYANSDGAADFDAVPGGLPIGSRPPGQNQEAIDIDNYEDVTLTAFTARLDFAVSQNADVGFVYRFEDYSIDSFITQGLTTYLPGALLLNANNGDYTVNVYASRLRFRF